MLPIIGRGQSMDGMLEYFVVVPIASLVGSQYSSGDYFAFYFQLADVLKRSTRQVVCLAYSDHLRWIEGEILEVRINIGHDVFLVNWRVRALKKKPRDEQGNLALTPRG